MEFPYIRFSTLTFFSTADNARDQQAHRQADYMAPNPDKSEAILLGTRQRAHSYSSLAIVNVSGSQIPLADHIKILGVTSIKIDP